METVVLFYCREYSDPLNSHSSRLQSALDDHVQIGPVTGIEVFKSAGTLVIRVQVPSQQFGKSKSWVRISRGIERYARQCVPTETDHRRIAVPSSQQSTSCGRSRVQEKCGHSPVRCEAAPEPKLMSMGFGQQVWESIAKALTKDCEFVDISRHFTKIPGHGGCHEAGGARRWDHVWTSMPSAEQTQKWDKEKWIDAVGRSADKSRKGVM